VAVVKNPPFAAGWQLALALVIRGALPLVTSNLRLHVGGDACVTVIVWLADPFIPLLSVAVTVAVKVPGFA
jgi:hypothetical protein